MRKYNILILLITLSCSASLVAQAKDSLLVNNISFTNYKLEPTTGYNFFNPKSTKTTFVGLNIDTDYINKPFFEVYNNASSLNDVYSNQNEIFMYCKSSYKHKNLYRGIKMDSFNPMGLPNSGLGVASGILNLALDRVQK